MKRYKYQNRIINNVLNAISQGIATQIIVSPTGSGKTFIATEIDNDCRLQFGVRRTLFLVHTSELAAQALNAFINAGRRTGLEMGDSTCPIIQHVVVGSVQSMINRLDYYPPRCFDLVFVDECHHMIPDGVYHRLLNHLDPKYTIGLTATLNRTDGIDLGFYFEKLTDSISIIDLIRTCRYCDEDILSEKHQKLCFHDDFSWPGYLCDIKGYSVPTSIDITNVPILHGDFNIPMLSKYVNIEHRNQIVYDTFKQFKNVNRAIGFCVDIKHAIDMAELFNKHKVPSAYISGELHKKERKRIIEDYYNGDIKVLFNCNVLTEGFDFPGVNCILMIRPTKSQSLYIQCIGRGARRAPRKLHCDIVDFVDVTKQHTIVTIPSLLGLSSSFNILNKSVVELNEEVLIAQNNNPGIDMISIVDEKDLHKYMKPFNILVRDLPAKLRNITSLNWVQINNESYRIVYRLYTTEITKNMCGYWDCVEEHIANRQKISIFQNCKSLEEAFTMAADWFKVHRSDYIHLLTKDATWRQRKPSNKMIAFAKKLRLHYKYRLEEMNQSEVAELIDNFLRKKAIKNAKNKK